MYFVLGAIVTLYPSDFLTNRVGKIGSSAVSWVGFVLVLGSAVWTASLFGVRPFWACVGASLLILAGPSAWVNRFVLGNRLAVGVGLISYPLYLVHWPLLSFAHITVPRVSTKDICFLLLFTAVFSTVIYFLVEGPIRKIALIKPRENWNMVLTGGFISIVFVLLGAKMSSGELEFNFQKKTEFLSERVVSHPEKNETEFWGTQSCFRLENMDVRIFDKNRCYAEQFPDRPKVILTGDSHAAYLSLGLKPILNEKQVNFGGFYAGWCTPFSVKDPRPECVEINKYVEKRVQEIKPDTLILFANYETYSPRMESHYKESESFPTVVYQRAKDFLKLGAKKVLILGQMPTWQYRQTDGLPAVLKTNFVIKHVPPPEQTLIGLDPLSFEIDDQFKNIKFEPGISYISLRDALCNSDGCQVFANEQKSRLMVFDYGHLTPEGGAWVTYHLLSSIF